MSIRFTIAATSTEATEDDVHIDAHHIDTTGTWFDHPIRSHKCRIGGKVQLLAYVALGFILHKGEREELLLNISHDDPMAAHGLEVVVMLPTEANPDLLPGALTLDQAGGGIEAVECERLVIAPGESAPLSLYLGNKVQIREVHMSEVDELRDA